MLKLKIIVGSTRPNRFSEKTLPWIQQALAKQEGFEVEVLDLRDFPLPFYDNARTPSMIKDGSYEHDVVKRWSEKIQEADAFLVITPEYDHSTSAVLLNAFDTLFFEWHHKPISFVAYGSVGGARAVEHLRQVAVELNMASTRAAVHIMSPWFLIDEHGELKDGVLEPYAGALDTTLNELKWWGEALKAARTK